MSPKGRNGITTQPARSRLTAFTTMAPYTATLYRPGQPAQPLSTEQTASLAMRLAPQPADADWLTESGQQLYADEQAAARLLGVASADLLVSTDTAAAYGLTNAADFANAQPNPAAEQAVWAVFGELGDLSGPILVIEQTTSQTPWVDGLTFIEEQHEAAVGVWFQLLHGPAGYYVHRGPTGTAPTHQHGPYTASELQGGRFEAAALAYEQTTSLA